MPQPKRSPSQSRAQLKNKASTSSITDFNKMRAFFPERLNIVSEGDSWFAYPPKWIIENKPSNLIEHMCKWSNGKANFLRLASNGDEIVNMFSGEEKHKFINLLKSHHKKPNLKPIDLLLISGGGNDLVGKNDFERFLELPVTPSGKAADYVSKSRLANKCEQIARTYEEVLDMRDYYSPTTLILTHLYDYPHPSNTGANFLGGLIKTKAWMKRYMDKHSVPEKVQHNVIKLFIDSIAAPLKKLETKRSGFIVVDIRNTLDGESYWLNEIHPDSSGFGVLAEVLFKRMKEEFKQLR